MSKLRVESFTISLDGFGAGPDQDINNPLGIGGTSLHAWALSTRTFQKNLFGSDGESAGIDEDFAARGFQNIGAWMRATSPSTAAPRRPAQVCRSIEYHVTRPTLAPLVVLLLLVLMEAIRTKLVVSGAVPANGFNPENSNLSPFMQRLARAHANCLEGLPVFGGLMLVAVVAGRSAVTDPLAGVLFGARVVQSCIHLASTSSPAVSARFTAFAVQVGIAVYWAIRLHGT